MCKSVGTLTSDKHTSQSKNKKKSGLSLPKSDFSIQFTSEIIEVIHWWDFLPFVR